MTSDVSNEDIVEIVTGFLLNSPPGEFIEVVTDVRGLLPNEALLNQSAPATFRAYNTDQFMEVQAPGGSHKVLITTEGEINNNEYLDPRGNQVVQYDHIRQEVTGSRAASGNEIDHNVEQFRAAFDTAAQAYVSEHYQAGAVTVYGKQEGGQNVITICLSSYKFNPSNYWNGRWRSQWTCKFGSGGGNITLNGQIRVNVHYYEDGNVQLTTDTPKQLSATGGNAQATATAAINAIKKCEQDFHGKLEASYTTLSDTTFKALRRVLPVIKSKIDWPKINIYKVGGDLGK